MLYRTLFSEDEEPLNYYNESDMYLLAVSPPYFIKSQTLGNKNVDHIIDAYYNIIAQYDWNTDIAYAIMLCESSGDSEAHNLTGRTRDNSHGLFQINLYGNLVNSRPTADWLRIPANNISFAFSLYEARGWKPWNNCYKEVKSR